jgi:hypothetical protein
LAEETTWINLIYGAGLGGGPTLIVCRYRWSRLNKLRAQMRPDDPAAADPKFIEDIDSSQEQLHKEVEAVFNQPIDPTIVEKMNRENEKLERLSQKVLAELGGDEAFRLIWGKQLNYAEASDLFELWWKSVDPATQNEINVATEDFEDFPNYCWKCLTSSGGSVMNATKETLGINSLYGQFQAAMPKITEERFTTLWIAAVRRCKILKRGRERSALKSFIDDYMHEMRQVLNSTFLIAANRPTSKQQRDREFSKSSYQGLMPRVIAQQWNRNHRRTKESVTSAGVSKAVARYRKNRKPVTWVLRVWIYQCNIPKLPSRTCPRCQGKGEIYFGAEWTAWHVRRLGSPNWRAVPKDDPEPPCPPPQRCEACDGSGVRGLKSDA